MESLPALLFLRSSALRLDFDHPSRAIEEEDDITEPLKSRSMPERTCRISLIQSGPAFEDKEKNVEGNLSLLKPLAGKTDFVLFPELSTTQYWPIAPFRRKRFADSEPIDGKTVKRFARKAAEISSYILLPFYERGEVEGEYFSSVALLSPEGTLVNGLMPDGRTVSSYRKNHLSKEHFRDLVLDEVSYMRTGTGFPVFNTRFGKVGILICRDRWFPESWRSLGLSGARVVFVATASPSGLTDLFIPSMRTWARENQVYGAICNKVGREKVERRTANYCGSSCIVGPDASLVKNASDRRPEILTARVDLSRVELVRQLLPNYRDRRPEIYTEITKRR